MSVSYFAIGILACVALLPCGESDASHTKLRILIPQRINLIHHHHNSVEYAGDYGYDGYDGFKTGFRGKGHRGKRKRRRRRRPYLDRKSYGLTDYASDYNSWSSENKDGSDVEEQDHHEDSQYWEQDLQEVPPERIPSASPRLHALDYVPEPETETPEKYLRGLDYVPETRKERFGDIPEKPNPILNTFQSVIQETDYLPQSNHDLPPNTRQDSGSVRGRFYENGEVAQERKQINYGNWHPRVQDPTVHPFINSNGGVFERPRKGEVATGFEERSRYDDIATSFVNIDLGVPTRQRARDRLVPRHTSPGNSFGNPRELDRTAPSGRDPLAEGDDQAGRTRIVRTRTDDGSIHEEREISGEESTTRKPQTEDVYLKAFRAFSYRQPHKSSSKERDESGTTPSHLDHLQRGRDGSKVRYPHVLHHPGSADHDIGLGEGFA